MTKSGKCYIFSIVGTTKTSKQGKRKPDITFHRFPEDDCLCPYTTLEHYLEFSKTQMRKGDRNQLLLSHIEPHRSVSTATVVLWVRSASTPEAKVMGLSTKDILKRGNWLRESTWQKYYRKHIVSYSENFQEKVLRGRTL